MRRTFFSFIVNTLFIVIIVFIVLAITTISITKKINDYNLQYQQGIYGVVMKDKVPILGLTKGIIKKIYVTDGDKVKAGQLLVEITNPLLEEQVKTLSQYKDNVSAQTQKSLAVAELQYNKVTSPVEGVVSDIAISLNTPVDEYSNLMTIYQNSDTKLLVYLTVNQYIAAEKMEKIPVFNPRLNQDFYFVPVGLKTNQEDPNQQNKPTNKIALYLKPIDPKDSLSLLNGETMQIELQGPSSSANKPVDYLVKFWNSIIQ